MSTIKKANTIKLNMTYANTNMQGWHDTTLQKSTTVYDRVSNRSRGAKCVSQHQGPYMGWDNYIYPFHFIPTRRLSFHWSSLVLLTFVFLIKVMEKEWMNVNWKKCIRLSY